MAKDLYKNVFRDMIKIELDTLREYTTTLEDLLTQELENLRLWSEKETSKLLKERQEDFYDFHSDDYLSLSEIFPNTLRSSLFVTCYSLLECRLIDLCKYLRKQHNYSIKLDDLRERGISGARVYLKKIMGINFPDQPPLWTDILVYKDIRNFIVHNDGRLGDSDKAKKVKAFINARSSISLDHRKRIRFSGDFYLEVINTLESFFDELLKALP